MKNTLRDAQTLPFPFATDDSRRPSPVTPIASVQQSPHPGTPLVGAGLHDDSGVDKTSLGARHSEVPNRVVGDPQTEPKRQLDPLFHLRLSRNPERRFLRFLAALLQLGKEPHRLDDERAGWVDPCRLPHGFQIPMKLLGDRAPGGAGRKHRSD